MGTKTKQAARLAATRRLAEEHARKVPGHAETLAREREILTRHKDAVGQVDRFALKQKSVADELDRELSSLLHQGENLDVIEQRQRETGFLASITRRFTARSELLARRSVAEKLLHHYQQVNGRLASAARLVDELRLTALELQEDVDRLHVELEEATDEEVRLAARIGALEDELDAITEDPSAARRIDQLMFEERTATTDLSLWEARARISRQGLQPARKLRDVVLKLHEDMAQYVTAATGTVQEAGRRIAALGAAADAAVVVSELQSSVEDLRHAVEATETYLRSTKDLYLHILPDLTAELEAHYATQDEALPKVSGAIGREEARSQAEAALVEAAEAELAQLLGEDPPS
ncbi:MAG: hypothetical protein KDA24_17640 [Deltaproteobacteria bacterium]|nr:hypothetical protein [Deltaproteobacteria bacterium]